MRRVRVVKDVFLGRGGPQVGEVWCVFTNYDYGMKSDHERITGEPHVNLIREDLKYPYYTVPAHVVKNLETQE